MAAIPNSFAPGDERVWYSTVVVRKHYLLAFLQAETICRPTGKLLCIPHGLEDREYAHMLQGKATSLPPQLGDMHHESDDEANTTPSVAAGAMVLDTVEECNELAAFE